MHGPINLRSTDHFVQHDGEFFKLSVVFVWLMVTLITGDQRHLPQQGNLHYYHQIWYSGDTYTFRCKLLGDAYQYWSLFVLFRYRDLDQEAAGKLAFWLAQSNLYSETSAKHHTAVQFRNRHSRLYLNMPEQNKIASGHTKRRFPNTDREVLKSTLSASPCLSVRSYTYSSTYVAGNLLFSNHQDHDAI
jgi:hypothetical protein